jgi:hypothetical protein
MTASAIFWTRRSWAAEVLAIEYRSRGVQKIMGYSNHAQAPAVLDHSRTLPQGYGGAEESHLPKTRTPPLVHLSSGVCGVGPALRNREVLGHVLAGRDPSLIRFGPPAPGEASGRGHGRLPRRCSGLCLHVEVLNALRASILGAHLNGEISLASLAKECGHSAMPLSCFLRCEGEVAEIGSLLRGAFRPEDE